MSQKQIILKARRLKTQNAVFRLKVHFTWRKSANKSLWVNTVSNKVVRHSLTYLTVQRWLVVDVPFLGRNWPTPFTNVYF